MLDFRRVELEDRDRIEKLMHAAPDRGCEYTFGNIYIWHDTYNTDVAFTDDGMCIVRFTKETDAFLFPVGNGNLADAIEQMLEDSKKRGVPFRVYGAGLQDLKELEMLFPGRFEGHQNRDYAEYVYNSEDLIELAGKKYHKKRNHISRFLAEYPGYGFHEITRENIADVRTMNDLWYSEYLAEETDSGLAHEMAAAANSFDHFFELGFKGGFIEVDGGIAAFAIGEPINAETFCVHIEKACYNVNGAYTVINRDFARHFCAEYRYINREDDVGQEGLRQAKLSYYPAVITEKYVVTEK